MKKEKGIKIIKKAKSFPDGNYTFIDDVNSLNSDNSSSMNMRNDHNDELPLEITNNNKEEKYKKRKVVGKNEFEKKFKALKFSNPSQRNHSSVYE